MFRANRPVGPQTEQQVPQRGLQQVQERVRSRQSRKSWTGAPEEQPMLAADGAVAAEAEAEAADEGPRQRGIAGRAQQKVQHQEQHWRQTSAFRRICHG